MIKNILFVCTGNSCRSVMAQELLKKMLKDKANNFVIRSAGTSALEGMSPTTEAQKAMWKEGVDISAHRSVRLTREMIEEADLILAMEEAHRNIILSLHPEAEKKTYLLKSFMKDSLKNSPLEIPDPIGKPPEVYEEVLFVFKESLQGLIKKFKLDK
ncbi:MAG: low molecular weight protein arginine phosphatase [Candidatus Omnitrophica bacterium]|nr:low molecular weight protein arginine phosphatase [Candidatus Omnitrophota bacterium]MCM8793508.1 low molecular weight protein arginine phosphatase [Candidatus Omnitrophota bacterium]